MIPWELGVDLIARGRRGKHRDRREEWDGVNRASWRLTIKGQGNTDVIQ